MDENRRQERQNKLLSRLIFLPKHIVSLNDHSNISEFVLHELCGDQCLQLKKAAYFVDNPDFNCLKGIAGFCDNESKPLARQNFWDHPDEFGNHLKSAAFNQKVRSLNRCSIRRDLKGREELANDLAQDLQMQSPQFHQWPMKYDNHGLLIFETADDLVLTPEENYLLDSLYLLNFCPIH